VTGTRADGDCYRIEAMPEVPTDSIHPKSALAWRKWLERHHARGQGVWLISYKLATGKPRMAYDEAVATALCFGWIDSKPRALDEERSMLWFAPRKKGSAWSKNNKERVEQLLCANLMHAAGLAKIEEAKQDGSWVKLDSVEALEIPPDLIEAFKAHPGAQGHFEAFPRSSKRAILEWIGNAKTEGTRAKRVGETAALAEGVSPLMSSLSVRSTL
jgi:uncharacterized protein YdeI (YjbR/CyaY-like superfamily)